MTERTADPRDPRPLLGEPLALDLLNTRWAGTPVNDLLGEPDGYAIWLSSAGLAGRCAADGAGLAAVREAREALAAAVRDLDGGGAVGPVALAGLDAVLRHGRVRREASATGARDRVEVDAPEWLAAWLAVDDFLVLLGQGPQRVKKCAHEACILHFFDTSQNGRRRWCRMAVCGNRAKAARHYEKVHQ
ncbi:CGNR zinc finger domain-containing protein [Streptomyces sp. BE20]|uniref:CGNR zinc finger domain-containing protein n=1 Tax=Streptomycetaceae TaxID=2062 RepID=UPI002E76DB96|nr:CGNR zinc finger domain-containing protein [Streptomyces sp. BE20]MEE1828254.1 CGNR zinc finger domain-containing protein [Streptomyces sp. BE20]